MSASSTNDTEGNDSLFERLVDEFAARHRRGEEPRIQEYVDRYPHLADELRSLLPAMVQLEGALALEAIETPTERLPTRYPEFLDFAIVREIGRGGMGVVYEAEQVSLGRQVALKVLTQRLLRDARQRLRFEREAKSAARLHHTNIVPVFGFGEHDGTPFYVMQYIEGAGLDAVIEEIARLESRADPATDSPTRTVTQMARSLVTGQFSPGSAAEDDDGIPLTRETTHPDEPIDIPSVRSAPGGSVYRPASQGSGVVSAVTQPRPDPSSGSSETRRLTYWQGVARLGVQIGAALDYAHKNGVLHRDVKPSNLLLDARGTVWVTDFGLAKADDQQNLTLSGDVLGTLRYMPPEALEGKADARGDIYSLGLTLYELVALRPAFDKRDRNNLIKQVTSDEAPRLGRIRAGVPRDLETIVHKAIEKDPALRYPTAGELTADLQRFLDDEPIRARRSPLTERIARWTRRNTAWAAVIAGAAALLIVLSVISTLAASYFGWLADQRDRLAKEEQRQRGIASIARDEAEKARELAQRRGDEMRANLYRAEMNLAAQAAAAPGGVPRVAELVDNWRAGRPDLRGWEWYYLKGLTHQAQFVMGGSGQPLRSVAWSPDGLRIASGGDDGWIRVWDADHGRELRAWSAHFLGVRSVAWSPDGDRIASAGTDLSIRVWDVTDGRQLSGQVGAHRVPINCVAWSPDATRLASGDDGDAKVKIWNADFGGTRGAPAGLSGLMGLLGGHALKTWLVPSNNTYGIAWSPDGHQVATTHHDGIIRIWDVDGGPTPRRELSGHRFDVYAVAWSPDGLRLVAGGVTRVRVWDASSGKQVGELSGHTKPVHGLAWSPDGRRIASASSDQTVRVWDPTIPSELHTLEGHIGRVVAVTWSPDSRRLASAGEDGSVRVWDPIPFPNGLAIHSPDRNINGVAWSPDGRRIASTSWDTTIRIWEPESGKLVSAFDIVPAGSKALAWNPDGVRLAAGWGEGRLGVWSAADGRQLDEIRWKGGRTQSLAWSPDGRRLAVSGWGHCLVCSWASDGSSESVSLQHRIHPANAVAWNHDGSRLATGESDATITIWDPAGRPKVRSLAGHTSNALSLAWSPDGRRLASGGEDNTIRIWDPLSGATAAVLRGHTSHVQSVAWSPDGTRLASGGDDHTVRLWDPRSRREILAFAGHQAGVSSVAWSPDGRRLASGGYDQRLIIRDVNLGYSAEQVGPPFSTPGNPHPHRQRAEALSRRADWDAAAAEFRQALATEVIESTPAFSAGWWAAGPFESAESEPNPGGDLMSPPWEPAEATTDGRLELGRYASPGGTGVAYAVQRVWSPVEAKITLRVGASGPVKVWLNNDAIRESRPVLGGMNVEDVRVSLPAGWSTLAFRVEAGGDRPALRAWLEGDADRARDKLDALLTNGRWSDAGSAIDAEATARPGTVGFLYSIAARVAHRRAAWLRGRGKLRDSAEAGRMAALWFDRLRAARPNDAEAAVQLAEFLADGLDPACQRTILEPLSMTSSGGATLTRLEDGSILASGTNPNGGEYTIEGVTELSGIRAIRLEALLHPSLPENGPGRKADGNFAISEISVRSAPADEPGRATAVRLARASASSGEARWQLDVRGPGKAIDGRPETLWDVWRLQGRAHTLWLDTAQPIGGPGRTRLTVTLSFEKGYIAGLGRFRLAVQARPGPGPALAPRSDVLVGAGAGDWPVLATVRAFRGEWAAARDVLLEDKQPPAGQSPVHDLLLSLIYDALDQDDLAGQAYERALGRDTLAGTDRDLLEFAIQVAGRRIARHPEDARLRVQRARWMILCERWDEQKIDLQVADHLAPDRWIEWAADFEKLLQARADYAAIDGDWRGSLKALSRLRTIRPDNHEWWWFSALVLAEARDDDELRRVSREMFARFGNTVDAHIADLTAQAGLLLPGSYDTKTSTALIDRAMKLNPGETWFRLTQGLAAYRAGRLDDAVRDLNECLTRPQTFLPEAAGFVLAMVHQKAGRTEEARRHLDQARDRLTRAITKEDRERARRVGIFVDVLRREAEELVAHQKSETLK